MTETAATAATTEAAAVAAVPRAARLEGRMVAAVRARAVMEAAVKEARAAVEHSTVRNPRSRCQVHTCLMPSQLCRHRKRRRNPTRACRCSRCCTHSRAAAGEGTVAVMEVVAVASAPAAVRVLTALEVEAAATVAVVADLMTAREEVVV